MLAELKLHSQKNYRSFNNTQFIFGNNVLLKETILCNKFIKYTELTNLEKLDFTILGILTLHY